jgi:hypothetical protein
MSIARVAIHPTSHKLFMLQSTSGLATEQNAMSYVALVKSEGRLVLEEVNYRAL